MTISDVNFITRLKNLDVDNISQGRGKRGREDQVQYQLRHEIKTTNFAVKSLSEWVLAVSTPWG